MHNFTSNLNNYNMADFNFGLEDVNLSLSDSILDSIGDVSSSTANPNDIQKLPTAEEIAAEEAKKKAEEELKIQTKTLTADDLDEELSDAKPADEVKKPKEEVDEDFNQFEALSKEFYGLGILTPDYDEEGNPIDPVIAKTPEEFKELWENQGKKVASNTIQNFLSKFGEDRQELFNAIFVSGVDPKEYIPVFNELQDFSSLEIDGNENNQELVIKEYYKRLNWDADKISKKIQKLKDYADLEEEAKDVHEKLIEQTKENLQQQETIKQAKLQNEAKFDGDLRRNLTNTLNEAIKSKELQGIPVTEKVAREAYDFIYTKKWKTSSGEQLTDLDKYLLETKQPENLKQRVILGLLAKNNFDLSKVKQSAVSKESNELFNSLSTKKKVTNKTVSTANSDWLNKL